MYMGLSTKEVRSLAFQYADKNKIKMHPSWKENSMASQDWLSGFLKRNGQLAIRTAEATSLSRASSFNRTNVNTFFDLLQDVLSRYKFEFQNIYNIDETGITTVQRPDRIIARKGTKQVGSITSAERGSLVTFCLAVNASGNSIPPMFLFPRKNYRSHFVNDGPPGSIGSANPSGWMTEEDFYVFLNHFVKHTRSSQDNPVLMILDNHSSHLSFKGISYCKENGVIVISMPPHCSHKLQPLDRSVFGPLKKYVNSQCDAWMRNNPGKTMTIYDIPGILKKALPNAITPSNIQTGFRVSGIYPFNRDIFSDDDFMPAAVTDRPEPIPSSSASPNTTNQQQLSQNNTSISTGNLQIESEPSRVRNSSRSPSTIVCLTTSPRPSTPRPTHKTLKPQNATATPSPKPSTSRATHEDLKSQNSTANLLEKLYFSPSDIRPTPKAGERLNTRKGRKKRKATIWTDTPNKLELEREQENKRKKETKHKAKGSGVKRNITQQKKKVKTLSESSEEEETLCLFCCGAYLNSKPNEKWIQCTVCRRWAHLECSDSSPFFICPNCDDNDDIRE